MISDFSTRTRTDKAYRLGCNIDHLGESEYDAWLINYPNPPGSDNFAFTDPLNLPERVEFEAIGSMLDKIDYMYTDSGWPIMSKRMLDTLLSVGTFPHRAYPVVMINASAVIDPKTKNFVFPRTENHNYVAVHLTEHLDSFDFENSLFTRGTFNPDVIDYIEWLVLKEPETGFPSLFTIEPISTRLFVSAEARAALEAANIQEIDFSHVEDETVA
jgi:hypothetical protein